MCTVGGGGGRGYETNYLTFGGYETNYDICGGEGDETKNEWNTMSMINKTTDFYNTIYTLKKMECMFLNVPSRKLQL